VLTTATDLSSKHVVVGVPTFRRPDQLDELLALLVDECAQAEPTVRVVVVDNDPTASARGVAAAWAGSGVEYHAEPRPGVAAARNRILDASGSADAVVFIDDDQRPVPGWLVAMTGAWSRWGCAAVSGPVVWTFGGTPDEWVEASCRFERRSLAPGSERPSAGTGNLLIDLEFVRRNGLCFDDRFGLSGGEDTMFTSALVQQGGAIRWCDDAEVVETVPAERLTRAWVLDRDRRSGSTWTRVHVELARPGAPRLRKRAELLVRGAWRWVTGAGRAVHGRLVGRIDLRAAGERGMASGAGMVAGVAGTVIEEYGRR
jgi:succinoglycan biosynthesis protein ExoM